jgi:glutamine synthetase
MSDRNVDFVLRTVEKRDIRFVRLWFTDVLGRLKSFAISSEDLEEAFEEGIGFDGSSVEGFVSSEESDMLAFPDPTTFQILPWRPEQHGVARVFCDIKTPSREPFEGDSRSCLERVFRMADAKGYVLNVGPRIEYFYFGNDQDPIPQDNGGYFELTTSDVATDLRRSTTLMLERMSIPVAYSFHATAPSQNTVELRYTEARSCADNIMTARVVIRQEAHQNGLFASFMPKPLNGYLGSGMFLYESLFDHEGNNLFWAPKTQNDAHLSELAQHYVAGLLKYAPESLLVSNPTVNSYKRLVPNGEVPIYTTWGRKNRTALVRIPTHKPGKHQSTRVELRNPDPTANPYLTIALTLAAGVRGIEEGLELPPEAITDPAAMSESERQAAGIERLPRDLGEAIERFEGSSFVREVLGDHITDFYAEEKRKEWDEYCSTVTEWERRKYYAGV